MKVAPVQAALARLPGVHQTLVHTGQHYDANMSEIFFHQLELRPPDDLAVRVEPACAVAPELVHARRRERRYHALAGRATRHEKHAPRFPPEADQVAGVDEDPARLG